MDTYILGEDIHVVCLRADRFPEGIEAAHEALHEKFPAEARQFFGISRPDQSGTIIYKAAVEETDSGEADRLGLERFTILRGSYNTYYIKDFPNHPGAIKSSFDLLIGQAEADPNGYCIEWYIGENDVKCMVRSADADYPETHHVVE
jgi:hypothetical protein